MTEVRPDAATFRRVLSRLDADVLIGAYLWTRTATLHGRRVIAIDGKSVRGPCTGDQTLTRSPPWITPSASWSGNWLQQEQRDSRLRDLVGTFDLYGYVVTVDAMHTQTETADLIVGADADYVLTVKANQPVPPDVSGQLDARTRTNHKYVCYRESAGPIGSSPTNTVPPRVTTRRGVLRGRHRPDAHVPGRVARRAPVTGTAAQLPNEPRQKRQIGLT